MKIARDYKHFVALLWLIASAAAQTSLPAKTVPDFTARGAFLAVVVTDLNSSIRWYESNLGLRLIKRAKSARLPAENAVLTGHNLFVELIHHDGKQLPRIDNEAPVPRLIKAGVIVGSEDFEAVNGYLQKRGIEANVFEDKEMGARTFLFKDNDGNLIQFFTQHKQ